MRAPSIVTKLSWKAPDAYLRSGGFDLVTAMTAYNNDHMIRMPASASQVFNTLKGPGAGGGEGLKMYFFKQKWSQKQNMIKTLVMFNDLHFCKFIY